MKLLKVLDDMKPDKSRAASTSKTGRTRHLKKKMCVIILKRLTPEEIDHYTKPNVKNKKTVTVSNGASKESDSKSKKAEKAEKAGKAASKAPPAPVETSRKRVLKDAGSDFFLSQMFGDAKSQEQQAKSKKSSSGSKSKERPSSSSSSKSHGERTKSSHHEHRHASSKSSRDKHESHHRSLSASSSEKRELQRKWRHVMKRFRIPLKKMPASEVKRLTGVSIGSEKKAVAIVKPFVHDEHDNEIPKQEKEVVTIDGDRKLNIEEKVIYQKKATVEKSVSFDDNVNVIEFTKSDGTDETLDDTLEMPDAEPEPDALPVVADESLKALADTRRKTLAEYMSEVDNNNLNVLDGISSSASTTPLNSAVTQVLTK